MIDRRPRQGPERCVLVGAVTRLQDETKANEYLDELRFLAETAGAETVAVFTQKRVRHSTQQTHHPVFNLAHRPIVKSNDLF